MAKNPDPSYWGNPPQTPTRNNTPSYPQPQPAQPAQPIQPQGSPVAQPYPSSSPQQTQPQQGPVSQPGSQSAQAPQPQPQTTPHAATTACPAPMGQPTRTSTKHPSCAQASQKTSWLPYCCHNCRYSCFPFRDCRMCCLYQRDNFKPFSATIRAELPAPLTARRTRPYYRLDRFS